MFERAHADFSVAGECLLAFRAGDPDGDEAYVGALLFAEALHLIRSFLTAKPKGAK